MGGAVDAEGETRHDRRLRRDQGRRDPAGGGPAGRTSRAGSRRRPPAGRATEPPVHRVHEQDMRRHRDRGQAARVAGSSTVTTRTPSARTRASSSLDRSRPTTIDRATLAWIGRWSPPVRSASRGVAINRSTADGPPRPPGSPDRCPNRASRAPKPIGPRPWAQVRTVQASRSAAYGSAARSLRAGRGVRRRRHDATPAPSGAGRPPRRRASGRQRLGRAVAGERNQAASSRWSARTADRPGQVGDRPGDPQQPLRAASARRARPRRAPRRACRAAGVSRQARRRARPRSRPLSRRDRAPARARAAAIRGRDDRRASGLARRDDGRRRDPRHRDPQVDPVAQRTRTRAARSAPTSPGAQRQRPSGIAPANPHGHGFIAATSWNRAGNVIARPARAIDDAPVLERLAQRLEHVAVELRQLVEEQDAVIGQGDLARRQAAARRRPSPRTTACGAAPGTAAARRSARIGPSPAADATIVDRQRLRVVERRQQPGDRPREQRLADPGGPTSSSPWPPARAISSARRASSWPRTSARSGTVGRRRGSRPRRPGRRPSAGVRVRRSSRRGIATGARRGRRPRTAAAASRQRRRRRRPRSPSTSRASSTADAGHDDPARPAPRRGRRPSAGCPGPAGPRRRATARR